MRSSDQQHGHHLGIHPQDKAASSKPQQTNRISNSEHEDPTICVLPCCMGSYDLHSTSVRTSALYKSFKDNYHSRNICFQHSRGKDESDIFAVLKDSPEAIF